MTGEDLAHKLLQHPNTPVQFNVGRRAISEFDVLYYRPVPGDGPDAIILRERNDEDDL